MVIGSKRVAGGVGDVLRHLLHILIIKPHVVCSYVEV